MITVIEYYVLNWFTHKNSPGVWWNTHFKSNDFSTGKGWVWRRSAQVFTSYSEKRPTQRELLGAARCRPGELKGPSFPGTVVYRVSRWLTLGISNFPSRS